MNGTERLLIDTNIIIYYLAGDSVIKAFLRQHRENLHLSVITKMEVLSYPYENNEDTVVRAFLECFQHLLLDEAIVEQTIMLRRQKKIKLPDAIIAATALKHQLTIVTRNTTDFNIAGLSIINPFETA
jgi:predicted nucleic acid-binding protein